MPQGWGSTSAGRIAVCKEVGDCADSIWSNVATIWTPEGVQLEITA